MILLLWVLQLLKELSESGLTEHQIWSSWHGDSHLIANDQVNRLSFSVLRPECLSRVPDPDFYPYRISDLGSRI
jgi:hypothetical protein